ncbi:2-polyprenyl-3-methyl-5-hydroxy-6-metoxy-1,4-benzoquinol methylase [Oceanihabitans sediminis]|uniref:Class I SAM-dependent methyltransferase n=1 Tax=Oceanihabitans sediminis TaxID=1812012 RepID=A0A368P7B3_9FLAO|nr:class I SAM-dependent methyltransferase [Oceanihabitans sediminis]RBP34693.1 2-polyprenyl-3-methyl-5-hydroxy-6-metoxy-1,4-benzoquinol methylase [Oceanihabitans sediminis]RCU58346.1 class I SAM-dependent methyltransferase [Oceanihabitans sediminis]
MKKKESYFKVKDYSVSGEEFELVQNKSYGFLETVPQPKEENLSEYYKTEDYISHTDSKRNLFEKAYHLVRSISLKRKLKIINSFSERANNFDSSEKKSLLDFGCGTGDFLQTAQKNNWKVLGIEPNQQAREIANSKTTNAVFNSEHLNKIEDQSFDVITLWHVLEHVPNLEEQISVFKKLLKENGVLIVAVPNYKSFDAKHYKNFWAAYDVPRHLWHFNQDSIASLFSKENMKVVNTLPMKFDSYYVSLLSEKYQNGFMNPFKAFWIGFRSNWLAKRSGEYSSLIYILKNS